MVSGSKGIHQGAAKTQRGIHAVATSEVLNSGTKIEVIQEMVSKAIKFMKNGKESEAKGIPAENNSETWK